VNDFYLQVQVVDQLELGRLRFTDRKGFGWRRFDMMPIGMDGHDKPRVFISYSLHDRAVAESIAEALERTGFHSVRRTQDLGPASEWSGPARN
jgi:hypothetical protein